MEGEVAEAKKKRMRETHRDMVAASSKCFISPQGCIHSYTALCSFITPSMLLLLFLCM